MKDMVWRALSRTDLANLLKEASQVTAQAVGGSTVYRITSGHRELLAVTAGDGTAVLIEKAQPAATRRRRRIDSGAAAKTSVR
jgi:hypothetical protein